MSGSVSCMSHVGYYYQMHMQHGSILLRNDHVPIPFSEMFLLHFTITSYSLFLQDKACHVICKIYT